MCVALYRALQYEAGDRKWTAGFTSSIVDTGIKFYDSGPSLENGVRTKCFNIKCPKCDWGKQIKIIVYFFAPILPILKIVDNTNRRKNNTSSSIFQKVGAGVMMALFLTTWILCLIDYSPMSSNLQEWGAIMGDATAEDGNSRYYLSNRWGYYHEYANKDSERNPGQNVYYNVRNPTLGTGGVKVKGQERGIYAGASSGTWSTTLGLDMTVGSPSYGKSLVSVGERFAQNYRIQTVGWFLFFMFVTYLVSLRSSIRVVMGIQGTLTEDFLVCIFWGMALWQMEDTVVNGTPAEKEPEKPAPYSSAPPAEVVGNAKAGGEGNPTNELTSI
jgi:hypothetical protein